MQLQQLSTLIVEKQHQLDRLSIELSALVNVESNQNDFIEQFVLQKWKRKNIQTYKDFLKDSSFYRFKKSMKQQEIDSLSENFKATSVHLPF